MTKLRLLKVVVQAVFVLDDGDSITEQVADPFNVPAAQWRAFADEGGQFDQGITTLAGQLGAETANAVTHRAERRVRANDKVSP